MSSGIEFVSGNIEIKKKELDENTYFAMTGVFLTEQLSKETMDNLTDDELENLIIDRFSSVPASEIRQSIQDGVDLSSGMAASIIKKNNIKIKEKELNQIPSTLSQNDVDNSGQSLDIK